LNVEVNSESDIDRLAALQQLDCQLKEKLEQVGELVGNADQFEAELTRKRAAVAALASENKALETQRADMDTRLESEGGKIRDSRMRQNRVRNDRELLALQREIDLAKEATQQVEEQMISVMEHLERVTQELADARAALQAMETQWPDEVAARREKADAILRGLEGERQQRDALAQGMNDSLRSKYEQIFERRGGTAVVEVRNGTCLGCHMNVPPQLFNELQKFRDMRQCPNCHRILYWRPEQ
jgi:predicted  nucleic acid-binding Zn-ribbon protein